MNDQLDLIGKTYKVPIYKNIPRIKELQKKESPLDKGAFFPDKDKPSLWKRSFSLFKQG